MNLAISTQKTVSLLSSDLARSALHRSRRGFQTRFSYTPFGYCSSLQTGAAGFTGEIHEPGTGFYMLGNGYRAYSPALKRFYSSDSLSPFEQGGLNSYAYCSADPINCTDPTGRSVLKLLSFAVAVGGFSAISAGALMYFGQDNGAGIPIMIGGGLLAMLGLAIAAAPSKPMTRAALFARRSREFRRMFGAQQPQRARPSAARPEPTTGRSRPQRPSQARSEQPRHESRAETPPVAPNVPQADPTAWIDRLRPSVQRHARLLLSLPRTAENDRALEVLRINALRRRT